MRQSDRDEFTYIVPLESLLSAARSIPGWSLAATCTRPNQEGNLVTELRFAHRGAFLFPKSKLAVEGVARVHEYVFEGQAHVWVTWRPETAFAVSI